MEQSNRILVPLDLDQSVGHAMASLLLYAEQNQAELMLFSVVEGDQSFWYNELTAEQREQRLSEQRQRLDALVQDLKQSHPQLAISADVAYGTPFIEIIKQADKHQCVMVAIDARRSHKKTACEYGSTTRRLMRKSALPIWAQPSQSSTAIKQIGAAVDISGTLPETHRLNLQILKQAAHFAKSLGATLQIGHAWHFDAEGYLRRWSDLDEAQIAKAAAEEKQHREQKLMELIQEAGLTEGSYQAQLLEGYPEEAIIAWVQQQSIDLMMMGTLCRSGIPGFVIGNTAERLLESLSCSLLTLKPEGFKSPVLL